MPTDTAISPDLIRNAVRERYGSLARQDDETTAQEAAAARTLRRPPGPAVKAL